MLPDKRENQSWVRRWAPAMLMMGLIFAASSIPANSLPAWSGWANLIITKGGHMLGYGLLALAVLHGFGEHRSRNISRVWLLVFLYAITDEFHQRFVPGRGASSVDVLIDGFGAAMALLLYKVGRPDSRNQSSNSSSNSSSSSQPSAGVR